MKDKCFWHVLWQIDGHPLADPRGGGQSGNAPIMVLGRGLVPARGCRMNC